MRTVLGILFALCAVLRAGEPNPGESVWIGERWFQFAGTSSAGERLWVYPHLDGVPEVFTEKRGGGWMGNFESRFDPKSARFENLFNAAEALNEVLYGPLEKERRRPAARLLAAFLELYDQPQAAYYLRPHRETVLSLLTEDERQSVKKATDAQRAILARLAATGRTTPRLTALERPRPGRDASEYYRRMLSDGYLDISVSGGNLYAEAWGTYNSWRFTEDFTQRLKKQGFRASIFRGSSDAALLEKSIRLLDCDIAVRVWVTGGSQQPPRILRGVANFTEGFARADVLIYHGHSNKDEGAYYLSEVSAEFPRFQIGMNDTRDLIAKLQGLNARAHQILVFQSCSSIEKYGYPVRAAFERDYPNANGHAGFVGNPTLSQQLDFAPRFAAFVEELCKGTGPREMLLRINAIRPDKQHTKPLAFRGVLQPRTSFILPRGVTIRTQMDVLRDGFIRTEGLGSDGRTYTSTDLFAQNAPGDIVQIVPVGTVFYGLSRDGLLFEAGPSTLGTMASCAATRTLRSKILQLCADPHAERLLLLCDDFSLRAFSPGDASLQYARIQPGKLKPQAVAYDVRKQFFVQAATGDWMTWDIALRRFEAAPAPDLSAAWPHLNGRGLAGEGIYKD